VGRLGVTVAQAMIESLTLITDDDAFTDLPGLRTVW
jgi:PIN domain nuclease of toxin-antitoxin system